jgi:hypothetical protein
MDRIENDTLNNCVVACLFVTAVTFLPSPYLAAIRGYKYRHTDILEEFIKNVVEIG